MKGKKRPDMAARNRLRKGLTYKEIYGVREHEMRKLAGSPGEKHPNWKGGKSYEPYSAKFTSALKAKILVRDGYLCQKCWTNDGNSLDVHHIDYDKQNCKPSNLVALCKKCHTKTNGHRKYWQSYFEQKIQYRTINHIITPVGEQYFGGKLK